MSHKQTKLSSSLIWKCRQKGVSQAHAWENRHWVSKVEKAQQEVFLSVFRWLNGKSSVAKFGPAPSALQWSKTFFFAIISVYSWPEGALLCLNDKTRCDVHFYKRVNDTFAEMHGFSAIVLFVACSVLYGLTARPVCVVSARRGRLARAFAAPLRRPRPRPAANPKTAQCDVNPNTRTRGQNSNKCKAKPATKNENVWIRNCHWERLANLEK